MGKFFLVGGFLGAAVTWAVMHFLIGIGLKGSVLDDALAGEYSRGRADGRSEAEEEAKKNLAEARAEIEKEFTDQVGNLAKKVTELKETNKKLDADLDGTRIDFELANKARREAQEKARQFQALLGRKSNASRQLLSQSTKLGVARSELTRRLAEAATVMASALIGWPDVALAKDVATGITGLAREHRRLAQDVQVYIDQHSRDLSEELGPLSPYREGVQEEDIVAADKLAAKIEEAIKSMKADKLTLKASEGEWSDSEVFVEPGDVIQVRTEGQWRMALNVAMAGAEGWDEASQYKVYRDARAGGLIMQIGISEESIYPAYLGKPIVADAKGRVRFRMNDKDCRDNAGKLKVQIVSCNPKAIKEVVALWKAFKK